MPSHRGRLALGALVAVILAGCGATAATRALPSGWAELRLASGAALPYPVTWQRIRSDPGSASAALFDANGDVRAYLNATPADSEETLAGWARFRVRHNAADGDRDVRVLSVQNDIALGAGRGSCVVDGYATSRTTYREMACVLAPAHGGQRTVLVGAAQPGAWSHERQTLEFAIKHFIA